MVSVGYPDYWDRGRSLDPQLFNALPFVAPLINSALKGTETEPLAKTIRAIARMVCHTFSGVTILALNGHGHDCLRLSRSMLEGAVNAAYLKKNPKELDDYLDFRKVSAKQLLDFAQSNPPSRGPMYSIEQISGIISEYESVAGRFTNDRGKVRAHWCRKQIRQMFEDVDLAGWYTSVYHIGSAAMHMNARGLFMTYRLDENLEPISYVPPADDLINLSLTAARISVLVALEAYKEVSGDEATGVVLTEVIQRLSIQTGS